MANGFLIEHADGRRYELANDKAGIALYRDTYMPAGFKIVKNPHPDFAVPDLSEPKPKVEKPADAKGENG